jgi:hypothetical protein
MDRRITMSKPPAATTQRLDQPKAATEAPPPFAEEVDRADARRGAGENRRIEAEEAEAQDDKAAKVDRVHGLAR